MSPQTPASRSPHNRLRASVLVGLFLLAAVSVAIAWAQYDPPQPLEIILPDHPALSGSISISGAVNNPGLYPFSGADTIGGLLQAAGGPAPESDPNALRLDLPTAATQPAPQRIDINRAEAWLLEALPGIGEAKAKAIIAYRQANGPFRHTTELMQVEGIGQSLYDQIKDLITVSE